VLDILRRGLIAVVANVGVDDDGRGVGELHLVG